jgi:S-formylglutathione hydrolase FrmB
MARASRRYFARRLTPPLYAAVLFGCAFTMASGQPLLSQAPSSASSGTAAPVALKGKLERIKVHGKSLEGNLLGESPAPEVSIYLPPSYETDRTRRYPVVYLLHGYTGTDRG